MGLRSTGAGAAWLSVFGTPVTRIDPTSNTVTHQFVGPGGDSVRYGNDALWVTDQKRNELWKIDVLQLLGR
jgi:virginiamycin B lyase